MEEDRPIHEVHYQLRFSDLMAFSFHHHSRQPLMIGVVTAFLVLVTVVNWNLCPPGTPLPARIIAVLVADCIIMGVFLLIMVPMIVLSMVSRLNRTTLKEHRIAVTDAALIEETEHTTTEQRWPGILKVARTSGHLFLYVAQHKAHVVPRRAFPSDEEWEAFCGFCKMRASGHA